ncbi:MAG: hypothetical protein DWQ05_19790 [Calditrichaeota bacterium]|nr:MAG: hypothetical protein DWQ05_19790 [Calditrichota bacterium]
MPTILFPFGQLAYIILSFTVIGIAFFKASKKHHVLLAAGIVTAMWQGGLWIKQLNFDIGIIHITFVALFVYRFINPGKKIKFKKSYNAIFIPWLLMTFWAFLAISKAINTTYALEGPVIFLIDAFFLWVLIENIRTPNDFRFLIKCVSWTIIIQSMISLLQFKIPFFKVGVIDDIASHMWWRAKGTLFHPNQMGIVLAFTLPVILRALIGSITLKDKAMLRLTAVALGLGFIALIATYNRGSWVGIFIGLFVMITIDLFSRGSKYKKAAIGLLSVGVIVVLIGSIKFGSLIIDRFVNSDADGQMDNRTEQTEEAKQLIKQHPILGVGYKNDDFYAREIFVHNNYLLIATEIGLPGLFFFLWFLAIYLALIWGGTRSKISFVSNYSKGFVASIIAFGIASIPGPDFWIAADVQRQFLIVLAVMISARRLESKIIEIQKNKKLNKSKISESNHTKLTIIK